jgi:hypothetical protein
MKIRLLVCLLLAVVAAGCARKAENAPPVATPEVTLSRPEAALGSPIDVTFRFRVAPDARFDGDYWVFVHYLDSDRELMWTDDHKPEVPSSQWKPGQVVEYTRTLFIPIYPYVGDATIEIGLYKPGTPGRLALAAPDAGQRSYRVAKLQLRPQTDNVFLVYKDGWHQEESLPDNAAVQWYWTKKDATVAFKNPRRDCVLYLDLDGQPRFLSDAQTVSVIVGNQVVNSFRLDSKEQAIHRIPISAGQLGTTDMVELTLTVDNTFVPALLPAANSRDSRELGIRVFHAFLMPQ